MDIAHPYGGLALLFRKNSQIIPYFFCASLSGDDTDGGQRRTIIKIIPYFFVLCYLGKIPKLSRIFFCAPLSGDDTDAGQRRTIITKEDSATELVICETLRLAIIKICCPLGNAQGYPRTTQTNTNYIYTGGDGGQHVSIVMANHWGCWRQSTYL